MEQREWFMEAAGERSMRSVASSIGVGAGNLSTWLKENRLSAEKVIAIAYELDIDPVQALIDTEHLNPHKVTEREEPPTVEELARRIQILSDKLQKRITEKSNIVNLDSRRNVHPNMEDMPQDAVAYDGPDEDQIREERNEWD